MEVSERTICDSSCVKEYCVEDLNEYLAVTTWYKRQGLTFRGQTYEHLTKSGVPSIKSRLLRQKPNMNVIGWRTYDASLAEWARLVIDFFPSETHLRPAHHAGVTDSPLFNPESCLLWDVYLFGSLATSHRPGIVALMQHYGFPTHFIDLTTDPLVAMWFATHSAVEATTAVWTYDRLTSFPETDRSKWPTVYVFEAAETLFLEKVGLNPEVVPRPFCQHAAFFPEVVKILGRFGVMTNYRDLNLLIAAIVKLRPPASLESGLQMGDMFPLEDRDSLYARIITAPCQHFRRYRY